MTSTIRTIAQGDGSGIVRAGRTLVRDAAQWRALWAAHAGPDSPAPPVDFSSDMVAAAFAGERPQPGFRIEIARARRDGHILTLAVGEHSPAPGTVAAQILVTPFHIVLLPRYDGEVRFVNRDEDESRIGSSGSLDTAAGGPLPPAARAHSPRWSKHAPSSTGLEPNFAAALAYLAGPFSGILILLVERANAYVRFHAWQAVIGLGGLGVLAAAALVLSFLTLLLSPFAFTVMYRLSEGLAILWVVVWIVCLVRAFSGSAWKLPVAGRYAERLATSSGTPAAAR